VATIQAKPVLARDHCLAPDRVVDAPIYGGSYVAEHHGAAVYGG
jgi:hypothetical protein